MNKFLDGTDTVRIEADQSAGIGVNRMQVPNEFWRSDYLNYNISLVGYEETAHFSLVTHAIGISRPLNTFCMCLGELVKPVLYYR
jgi:hypothetical protein